MISRQIIIISIFLSLLFNQYMEIDVGYNKTLGQLDKYSDNGFSLRATYSNNIQNSDFVRWQGSFQYISFYSDSYTDSFTMQSGNDGPEIEVTNSESGYILQGGIRFTPESGLFNNGLFKPYIAGSLGLGYFNEVTEYEDPDNFDWWWESDDDDEWGLDDIEHQQLNFVYTLEFGANLNFKKFIDRGLDIGVRYTMIPGMESFNESSNYIDDTDADQGLEASLIEIGENINANYVVYYIGASFSLGSFAKQQDSGIDAFRRF